MDLAFIVLTVAFAAFCVWLTVRIVNRREQWAKRLGVATVVATMLYLLSIGPAAWLRVHVLPPSARRPLDILYTPFALINMSRIGNRATVWWIQRFVSLEDFAKTPTPTDP
jgi:hypothetical protein